MLDLVCDILGAILYSVGLYTFAKTANFAPGGLSGLALIINYLWDLPIEITTLFLNIPFILFSYKLVGKKFLLKSLKTMVFCTIFVDFVFPNTFRHTLVTRFSPHCFPEYFLEQGLPLSI